MTRLLPYSFSKIRQEQEEVTLGARLQGDYEGSFEEGEEVKEQEQEGDDLLSGILGDLATLRRNQEQGVELSRVQELDQEAASMTRRQDQELEYSRIQEEELSRSLEEELELLRRNEEELELKKIRDQQTDAANLSNFQEQELKLDQELDVELELEIDQELEMEQDEDEDQKLDVKVEEISQDEGIVRTLQRFNTLDEENIYFMDQESEDDEETKEAEQEQMEESAETVILRRRSESNESDSITENNFRLSETFCSEIFSELVKTSTFPRGQATWGLLEADLEIQRPQSPNTNGFLDKSVEEEEASR